MQITAPAQAVEGGTGVILTGSALDLLAPVYIVATNGTKTFQIEQSVSSRDAASISLDLVNCGLILKINFNIQALAGVPLTDSNWSLKWVVGADELGVVISPPANYQQREIAESEKFGGILSGVNFGTQDQLFSPIATAGNTIKTTESNGKATGYFDGVERTMAETITHYIYTAGDGKWRARDEAITTYT